MLDWTGQKLGSYQVAQLLQRSDTADTYLGQHSDLGTEAAIKVFHGNLSDADLQTFLQEASSITNLTHPNIVRLLEFGEADHAPYMITGYCPNGSLRQRHRKGIRVYLSNCVDYIKQIAEALNYAHERKIIHRNLRPENFQIGQQEEILLSDFGTATLLHTLRYQKHQDSGDAVAYLAPEDIQGRPCDASDQYSLGIVLYEWLTGELPYQGSYPEVVRQHFMASPPTVRDKVPSVPPEVEEVIRKALAKRPQERYAEVGDFADALEAAAEDKSASTSVYAGLATGAIAAESAPVETARVDNQQATSPVNVPATNASTSDFTSAFLQPGTPGEDRDATLTNLNGQGAAGETTLTDLGASPDPRAGASYEQIEASEQPTIPDWAAGGGALAGAGLAATSFQQPGTNDYTTQPMTEESMPAASANYNGRQAPPPPPTPPARVAAGVPRRSDEGSFGLDFALSAVLLAVLLIFLLTNLNSGLFSPQASSAATGGKPPTTQATAAPTQATTTAPTATSAPGSSAKTIAVNRQLTCQQSVSSDCAGVPVQATVVSFATNPSAQHTTMMLTLSSSRACQVAQFVNLSLQNASGKAYQDAQLDRSFSLVPGQPMSVTATYAVVPSAGSTYMLSAELMCDLATITYVNTQYTF